MRALLLLCLVQAIGCGVSAEACDCASLSPGDIELRLATRLPAPTPQAWTIAVDDARFAKSPVCDRPSDPDPVGRGCFITILDLPTKSSVVVHASAQTDGRVIQADKSFVVLHDVKADCCGDAKDVVIDHVFVVSDPAKKP